MRKSDRKKEDPKLVGQVKAHLKKQKYVLFLTEDRAGRRIAHKTTNAWFASQLHLRHFGIKNHVKVKVFVIFKEEAFSEEICKDVDCIKFQKYIFSQYN